MVKNNKIVITVFTPLYNRAQTIGKVYESLSQQTCYDFEWLVINDGSTDNSGEIMKDIIKNHNLPFPISYIYQENKGLTRTINEALNLANGILLFRLDSDDFALPNAIKDILHYYPLIKNDNTLCSITFLSLKSNGQINGMHPFNKVVRSSFSDYRDKYKAKGDRAEVMKLEIYRNFKYPEIVNEKFCPEGIIWNRLSNQYDAIYIPKAIYIKSDCDDSITANVYTYLRKNSKGVTLYYKEIMCNIHFSFSYRFKNAIKYYRYAPYAKASMIKGIPLSMLIALPFGFFVVICDIIKRK